MARQINSPKENVASSAILIVQNAVTKMKEIIVSDIANGVSKKETTKKLNQIIAVATSKIGSFDADMAEEARASLVISGKKWYYTYSVNTRVLNTALVTDFRNKIVEHQQGTGMSQTNRLYTIDINALSKELTGAHNSNSIRTVLDKFRPFLKESNKGLAIIDNYQQMVRDQVKVLASDPPISNRTRQDGQPYKVSLRNRAEMKVRYEANQEDINNLKGEGVKLVWTSSHADASPRCAPYQGRLWSLDGTSGVINGEHYEPIENATAGPYGDGNGIISGYNCRHRLIEYEAGSKPPHDFSEDEIKKAYAMDQKQRSMENNIRHLKTQEKLLRMEGNHEVANTIRDEWRTLNLQYEELSHRNGRAYYPWRTRISEDEEDFDINVNKEDLSEKSQILLSAHNKYKKAVESEVKLTKDIQTFTKKAGAYNVGLEYRLKSKGSLTRKIHDDFYKEKAINIKTKVDNIANKIYDVNRYTAILSPENFVDQYLQINKALLKQGYEIIRVRNTFVKKNVAYKGINNTYKSPDGNKFELQFHTQESFDMKEKVNHPLYEEARSINTSKDKIEELNQKMIANTNKLTIPKDIDKIKSEEGV